MINYFREGTKSRGSALLIVLAFLLLLTTLTVAFLSRATFERQLSNASFSQGKVDFAAQGAITAIIGDLQQEVVAGSTGSTTTPTLANGFYYPNSPATAVPALVGFTPGAGLENLVKISQRNDPFWPNNSNYNAAVDPSRASSVNTLNDPSLNNRFVSNVRWNKPVLMQPINIVSGSSTTDFTPPAGFTSNPPDWIYVARDGSNPTGTSLDPSYIYSPNISPTTTPALGSLGTNPVTQRYAYAIYDEGGTLDLNVAGSPVLGTSGSSVTYSANQPYKNGLAYADLTQLPGIGSANGSLSALSPTNQKALVNAIVGWRNYATMNLVNTSNIFPNNYAPTAANATSFDASILFNASGFLTLGATSLAKGNNFKGTANQSDNAFVSRQQLLQFFLQGLGQNSTFTGNVPLANLECLLPFFGTFSRDISQPSYAPDPNRPVVLPLASGGNDLAGQADTKAGQNLLNPAFLFVTATSAFIRNDGSVAVIGEPLVKKRFALNRLAWLTYRGPSAYRTIPTSNPGVTSQDYDMWLLVSNYGIPATFLKQGTNANILNYFGLEWLGPNNVYGVTSDSSTTVGIGDSTQKWKYIHGAANTGATPTTTGSPGSIMTLSQVQAAGRDADFFELLKAAITVGSIAKPGTASGTYAGLGATPDGYSNRRDSSVDASIVQLAANIIDQSKVDNYCTRIILDDGTTFPAPVEYRGIKDLPYIYRMRSSAIKVAESAPTVEPPNVGGAQVGGSAPVTTPFTNYGSGAYMEVPEIWNPNTWNPQVAVASKISPFNGTASEFKMLMLSTDPVQNQSLNGTIGAPYSLNNGLTTTTTDAISDTNLPGSFQFPNSTSCPALSFTIPSSRPDLFREPTLLNKQGIPAPSGLSSSVAPVTCLYQSAAYTGNSPNSAGWSGSNADNRMYIGFNLAPIPSGGVMNLTLGLGSTVYPLWFAITAAQSPTGTPGYVEVADVSFSGNTFFTYRLQYLDPIGSGNYITYDEKFLPLAYPRFDCDTNDNAFLAGAPGVAQWTSNFLYSGFDPVGSSDYFVVADPRSDRWVGEDPKANLRGNTVTSVFSIRDADGLYTPPPCASSTSSSNSYVYWKSWVDAAQNEVMSARPDYLLGWPVGNPPASLGFYNARAVPADDGTNSYATYFMCLNLSAQNTISTYPYNNSYLFNGGSPAVPQSTAGQFYADPDGVVRRGTSAYSTSQSSSGAPANPYGLPTATSSSLANPLTPNGLQDGNRPVILARPFRTVAELGYTYSGTPWRNIDFSTPESGYSAVLDVFCINDTNDPNVMVAGKVDLNTRQPAVLEAVLAGAYKNELSASESQAGTSPSTYAFSGSTNITSSEASALISDATNGLIARTNNLTSTTLGPLRNLSELVGKYVSLNYASALITGTSPAAYNGSQTYSGFSADMNNISVTASSSPPMSVVQRFHESAIRALSAAGTTRVWNLMIDVIAQTGRFPSSASNLANFNVEGERRYWVHVAIDRYTGKVLDEQVEEVKE